MPIATEQLNTIKAANHAKSQAWEEERFLTGDRVVLYQRYYAKRLATNTWLDEQSNTEFETLSRWVRYLLNRPSATIKQYAIMLAYPGATRGTYKFIDYLPLKDRREPHMLPLASANTICSSDAASANASCSSDVASANASCSSNEASANASCSSDELPIAPKLTSKTVLDVCKEMIKLIDAIELVRVASVPAPAAPKHTPKTIMDVCKEMIKWIDCHDTTNPRKSAGIGELVDFLTENKDDVIACMKQNILWHLSLNAIMTAYMDEFIDNEDYEDIIDEKMNEYCDNFTFY